MKIKVKLENGDEVEVERPTGLLDEAEVREKFMPKATFESELKTRVDSIIANKGLVDPETLMDSEDFKVKFMEHHEISSNKTADQYKADLANEAEKLRRKEVTPLKEALETANKRIVVKNQRELSSILLTAAAGRVKTPLLKGTATSRPAFVAMVGDNFGFSDEHDTWFVKNSDGSFAFPKKGDSPYKTPEEFVEEWLEDEANADFLAEERQHLPGIKPGGTPKGGRVTISRADAEDTAKYREARAQAQEAGQDVPEIVD